MIGILNRLLGWRHAPETEAPRPAWEATQLEIFALYPIGHEFSHRGRSLIVTGHRVGIRALFSNSIYIPPMPPVIPAVITHYADDRGRIHELGFGPVAFPFLRGLKDRATQ